MEESEKEKILEVSSLSLNVQSMWAYMHTHIGIVRRALSCGMDSKHVRPFLGSMCLCYYLSCPTHSFSILKGDDGEKGDPGEEGKHGKVGRMGPKGRENDLKWTL